MFVPSTDRMFLDQDDLVRQSEDAMIDVCVLIDEIAPGTRPPTGTGFPAGKTVTRRIVKCWSTPITRNVDTRGDTAGVLLGEQIRIVHLPLGTPVTVRTKIELGDDTYQIGQISEHVTGSVDIAVTASYIRKATP